MSKQFNPPWRKLLLLGSAVVIIIVIVGAGIVLTTPQPTKLYVANKAPSFTLVDQNNDTVTLNNYLGKVLVMDFIYTHCPNYPNGTLGECSTETANMNNMLTNLLQMGYTSNDFHFISVSIDWKFDNVSIMKAYGEDRAEGQFQYWSFLSGSQTQIKNITSSYHIEADYENTTTNLNQTVPLVTTQPSVNNNLSYMRHSLLVYLIDKNGSIRVLENGKNQLYWITGTTWSPKEVAKQVSALIKE